MVFVKLSSLVRLFKEFDMITETGDYLTRDGTRVTIFEIRPGTSTFEAKGSVWKEFRGKIRPREFNIWKTNGQHMAVGEHRLDIVKKVQPGC